MKKIFAGILIGFFAFILLCYIVGVRSGSGSIHKVALKGNLVAVKRWIEKKGADVNIADERQNGMTPLHLAAGSGYLNIVEYLVSQGAFIDITDNAGITPLGVASAFGRVEIVKYLLQQGASPNIAGMGGITPLHAAAGGGHLKVVKSLVDYGASLYGRDDSGAYPIGLADKKGHSDVVEYLKVRIEQDQIMKEK